MRHPHVFFLLYQRKTVRSELWEKEEKMPQKQQQKLLFSVLIPTEKSNSLASGNVFGGLSCD